MTAETREVFEKYEIRKTKKHKQAMKNKLLINFDCVSDGFNFIFALKKSKKLGILYMDRIHTKKDTIYQEENIDFLKKGSIKLTEML